MSIDDQIADVVGSIYDTALNPEGWPSLLESLAGVVGGQSGGLHVIAAPASHATYNYNRPQEFLDLFNGRFRDEDRWVAPAMARPVGTAMTGSQLMPVAEFLHTAYYQECCRIGDVHDTVCMILHADPAAAIGVTLNRPDRVALFGDVERRALQSLSPHLLRLAKIHVKFGVASVAAQLQERALDRLAFGVALLSRDFGVVFVNKAARAFAARNDGLRLAGRRVGAVTPADDAKLAAAQAAALTRRPKGAVLQVARANGARAYVLQVMPLGAASASALAGAFEGGPGALVVVTDPAEGAAAPIDLLAALWGLTAAEARLCVELAAGRDLAEAGAALGIAEHTARWHLKNVFSKTGVRRQSALVRLLAASLAPLVAD